MHTSLNVDPAHIYLTGAGVFVSSGLLRHRRFTGGIDALQVGGCLDAPDFIPAGGAACEFTVPVFTRDEVPA